MKRKLVAAIALTAVLLVQLTIVNGLALPGGATPDTVLLCVIAFGIIGGPGNGLMAGFWAGLALDLAPPASQLVGQYALVLCLVGYGAGRLRFTVRHSALLALAAAAAMAALGEALAAGVALVLDAPDASWAAVVRVLPPSVLLDIALSPVVLFGSVRLALALGITVGPADDSPVPESGGSAAPATVAARAATAGIYGVNVAGMAGTPRGGRRRSAGGESLAAATGRWLVGDVGEAAPAIGAVGWLAGPASSRRARREQARLTATLTGACPRKGAVWVGRRPPGLMPTAPLVPPSASGLARLRPVGGVAGSAVAVPRSGQAGQARPGRAIHLGLADEQRKRARAAGRRPAVTGFAAVASDLGGLNRIAVNGVRGPDVPRIAFGTGGLPGAGRAAGRPVPRIAFRSSNLGSAARAGTAQRRAGPRFRPRRTPFAANSWLAKSVAGGSGLRLSGTFDGALTAPGSSVPGPYGSGYRGIDQFGSRYHDGRIARSGRKRRQPSFARSTSGRHPSRPRQPKTARMSSRHGLLRRLPWMRRAGDRSAVWRIGSSRMSGLR